MNNNWLLAVMAIAILPTYLALAEENPPAEQAIELGALPKNTRIAVVSENAAGTVITTVNPDGSNPLRLTADNETSMSPSWSPDGKRIAYASKSDGKLEIHVMNADGTGKVQLTNSKTVDEFFGDRFPNFPTWSPDGNKIAYVSSSQAEHRMPEIYVMNADGTNPTRLTQTKVAPDSWIVVGLGPVAWSPDGNKIVFSATKDDRLGIHVIDADGTNPVSFAEANGSHASWSPDGKRIVFMSQGEPENGNKNGIRIMDAEGTNLISLPNGKSSYDGFPSWLPDGQRIAFTSRGDGDKAPGIYIMNAGGTNPTLLLKESCKVAVWSPFLQ